MKWRIYYEDGSSYSEDDGHPEFAPKRGVIAIAQANEITGQHVEHATTAYCWMDEQWRGCDEFGLFDYLSEPGWKLVLYGRWTTTERYREIVKIAQSDPDLPKRSAKLRNER